ncbi:sugar ABC transporter permease [Streptomyces sp. NPDC049954]|uniref:carbohydrate ABC transporter permease n=1 Tax=Streptomyces sp. NPDC049954 TaxID=3155779 RepID=UPI00344A8C67
MSAAPMTLPRARRRGPRALAGRHPVGVLMVLPFLAYVGVVYAYPFGYAVWMALHDYFFTAPGAEVAQPFTGLSTFRTVFSDGALWSSLGHLGVFLALSLPLTLVVSLALALALRGSRLRGLLSALFYLPYASSSVAVICAWIALLSGDGVLSGLLGGAAPEPSWLVNSGWAMPVIALFVSWKMMGFHILTYLAALQNVPGELYEAATVDGAGRWRTLWTVTVPGVRPATTLIVVLSLVTSANLFTEPYLLTGSGGPDGASSTPLLLIYQKGVEQSHPGQAAAIGIVLTVVVVLVSLVAGTLMERGER